MTSLHLKGTKQHRLSTTEAQSTANTPGKDAVPTCRCGVLEPAELPTVRERSAPLLPLVREPPPLGGVIVAAPLAANQMRSFTLRPLTTAFQRL